jgi:histidinol-phosphatase (PHP family)
MLVDYHVHTPYCGHAKGKIFDYVQAAVSAGLSEIGFADHLGRYYLSNSQRRRYWDWGMDERNLARYVAELLDLRDMFRGRINVKIGLEIDYIEGAEDLLLPIVQQYPFDFFLCSIHCIPQLGWRHVANFSTMENTAVVYKEYFRCAKAALKSGIFQALAHPDFIWRYIPWPTADREMPFTELAETVRTAAEAHSRIEINANALIWSKSNDVDGRDPFAFLLDELIKQKVPITLGSDAHEPMLVAKLFPEVKAKLLEKGITEVSCFTEGKAKMEKLG